VGQYLVKSAIKKSYYLLTYHTTSSLMLLLAMHDATQHWYSPKHEVQASKGQFSQRRFFLDISLTVT